MKILQNQLFKLIQNFSKNIQNIFNLFHSYENITSIFSEIFKKPNKWKTNC